MRETEDVVEKEGLLRTWKVIKSSDLIVFVHDCTKSIDPEELNFIDTIKKEKHKELIFANNKIDIQKNNIPLKYISEKAQVVEASALNNIGIESLKDELLRRVLDQPHPEHKESVIITNERHYSAILKAKHSMTSALNSLKSGKSEEFIAIDLRSAIDSIGEIIGLITTEEILNNIFSKFCIGK